MTPANDEGQAGDGMVKADCVMMGFPRDAGWERELNYVGEIKDKMVATRIGEDGEAPLGFAKEWVMIRLLGGPHDGQVHTMPATCSEWSCRCGAWYK